MFSVWLTTIRITSSIFNNRTRTQGAARYSYSYSTYSKLDLTKLIFKDYEQELIVCDRAPDGSSTSTALLSTSTSTKKATRIPTRLLLINSYQPGQP